MSAGPRVGVVVVNWFGGERTLGCLAAIRSSTWPADLLAVALVDNGSEPGFVETVRERFPEVRLVETGANLGFGGACNRGFEELRDCDHVALVNNDAVPDPGWLEPLVEVLEADRSVGAVNPKVLLQGSFLRIELRSASSRPGGGDPRALGVQLCGARVDGVDVSDRVELVSGFWGWEHDAVTVGGAFAWTDGRGVLLLPVGGPPVGSGTHEVELRLACGNGPTHVQLGGIEVPVDVRPIWAAVPDVGPAVDVINNAGMELRQDGSTADRGYLEPDGPTFAQPSEVWGWSGAAVLLSRRFLDDVGGFDVRFFLYAEDADLSWRGRLRGWRYCYEPRSVVRHEHSATVGGRSSLATHLARRNRLLLLVKCAPASLARAAVLDLLREIGRAAQRDVLRRLVTFRRPVPAHLVASGRVLVGWARMAPRTLIQRRALQRQALRPQAS